MEQTTLYITEGLLSQCQVQRNRTIYTLKVIAGWLDDPRFEEDPQAFAHEFLIAEGYKKDD